MKDERLTGLRSSWPALYTHEPNFRSQDSSLSKGVSNDWAEIFLLLLFRLARHLVVVLTDSLEHHGRNPTDVSVVLNHEVGAAAHQVVPCWKSALCCVYLYFPILNFLTILNYQVDWVFCCSSPKWPVTSLKRKMSGVQSLKQQLRDREKKISFARN